MRERERRRTKKRKMNILLFEAKEKGTAYNKLISYSKEKIDQVCDGSSDDISDGIFSV